MNQHLNRFQSYKHVIIRCVGATLAAADESPIIRVWDIASGKTVRTFDEHKAAVKCVAYSPDGRWLASGSNDTSVIIRELATGNVVHTLKGHRNTIYGLAWSPDGTQLASSSFDRTVCVWDLNAS